MKKLWRENTSESTESLLEQQEQTREMQSRGTALARCEAD